MIIVGDRTESWRLDAVTPDGSHVATLPLVPGSARRDWVDGRQNPLSITARVDGTDRTDFEGLWLRLTHTINDVPYLLATCVATDAPEDLERGRHYDLEGVDPTYVLSDLRALRRRLVCPAGTPVAETVRGLISQYAPEVRAVIGDTDETLREQLTWDAGTPVLTPINALLDAAGYNPLGAKPDGTLHSERWVSASQRPVAATIGPDVALDAPFIGKARIGHRLHRPTEALWISPGGSDSPELVGRWPEYVPDSPVTISGRGDATSQAVANLKALGLLEEAWAVGRSTTVTGPLQPDIEPGMVVRWYWPRQGIDAKWLVLAMDTAATKRSPTPYRLQEVL